MPCPRSRRREASLGMLLLLLLLVGPLPIRAAQASELQRPAPRAGGAHPQEPWKWTVEERLALRFDPADMHRRAAEHAATERDMPPIPDGQSIVIGARDPELLLSFELFRNLLSMAFHPEEIDRRMNRKEILEKGRILGLDENFWPVLENLARDEIRSAREASEKAKRFQETSERPADASLEEQMASCAKRARARDAVRAYLGAERFDRLLYEAIAPHVNIFMSENPAWPERLHFVEGGCQ